ncbi:MAG: DegT/DnrJ/EryC1/StrS family aminotransferase [Phycisphaerae bacterium]|nr:DegT/DnrJ/EryC1/StrS family aminotransferase [Phycisphaerae bacterium]
MKLDWPSEFPGAHWLDEKEDQAVLDVLHKGSLFRYYGLGQPTKVDQFEAAAREFYGAEHALGLNSGTGALLTSMTALDVGPGCEVIVPAFLWVATVGAIVQLNAIPVLCEVDESLTMDPKDLEKKITPRTKLIVPIHMAGVPCDMDAIMAVAKKRGVAVLEDCAQCNGGSYKGKKVGTFGDMGIFSLQLNKNMTCGEGGLIITNDERLYHRAFAAHDMGMIRVGGRLAPPPEDALLWGAGRRMTELCGAVAGVQIAKLPQIVDRMRQSKRRIKSMLEGTAGLAFRQLCDAEGDSGPFLVLILESEAKAVRAAERMRQSGLHNVSRIADYGLHIYYNIPSLVGKVPLSSAGNPWSLPQNAESRYDYGQGACPRSDELFTRAVLVPIPSKLTAEQEKAAAAAIKESVTA